MSHYVVTSTLFFFCDDKELNILDYRVVVHLADGLVRDSLQSELLFCFGEPYLHVYQNQTLLSF